MQSQVVESGEFDTCTVDFYHIHFEALVEIINIFMLKVWMSQTVLSHHTGRQNISYKIFNILNKDRKQLQALVSLFCTQQWSCKKLNHTTGIQ